jgi:hypothetical protein
VQVERLYDSQEASARLSHAISTLTTDKDARIASLERELAAERHSFKARIADLEARLAEQQDSALQVQLRSADEREKMKEAVTRESKLLHDEIHAVTSRGELELMHSQKALEHTQHALDVAQQQQRQDAVTISNLEQQVSALEETLHKSWDDFQGLEQARHINNNLVAEVDDLRELRRERMHKEVAFLDSYKSDMVTADARMHELLQQNVRLTNEVAELEASAFEANDTAITLRQALSQHADTTHAAQTRLTHEVRKLNHFLLLARALIALNTASCAFVAWLSRRIYLRKLRCAQQGVSAAHRRSLKALALRQLQRYSARRRHFKQVHRAIVARAVAARISFRWVLLRRRWQLFRVACGRAGWKRGMVLRRVCGCVVRSWHTLSMHGRVFALNDPAGVTHSKLVMDDYLEVAPRLRPDVPAGSDVRVRRPSAQAGRMADLLHGMGISIKRRCLLLWHACTAFRRKLQRLTSLRGIYFHIDHRFFVKWRENTRMARREQEKERRFVVINNVVACLLCRFEAAVLRVWRSEARKIRGFRAMVNRVLARFRLGPFAEVFFIWKYFTLALGAMDLSGPTPSWPGNQALMQALLVAAKEQLCESLKFRRVTSDPGSPSRPARRSRRLRLYPRAGRSL